MCFIILSGMYGWWFFLFFIVFLISVIIFGGIYFCFFFGIVRIIGFVNKGVMESCLFLIGKDKIERLIFFFVVIFFKEIGFCLIS